MTPTAPHSSDAFVPLLECSYGSYHYRFNLVGGGRPLFPVCHNPVERSEDRHQCRFCASAASAVVIFAAPMPPGPLMNVNYTPG